MSAPIRRWLAEPLPRDVAAALERLARCPDVRHVAVMPDVHLAHDVCVGTVVATSTLLYPSAVGGDIGCGMAALAFDAGAADVLGEESRAAALMAALYDRVPANRQRAARELPAELAERVLSHSSLETIKRRDGRVQLGTLGRGNHFLEFQADEEEGRLWVMLHTGSRGVGQAIRDHHLEAARVGRVAVRGCDDARRCRVPGGHGVGGGLCTGESECDSRGGGGGDAGVVSGRSTSGVAGGLPSQLCAAGGAFWRGALGASEGGGAGGGWRAGDHSRVDGVGELSRRGAGVRGGAGVELARGRAGDVAGRGEARDPGAGARAADAGGVVRPPAGEPAAGRGARRVQGRARGHEGAAGVDEGGADAAAGAQLQGGLINWYCERRELRKRITAAAAASSVAPGSGTVMGWAGRIVGAMRFGPPG